MSLFCIHGIPGGGKSYVALRDYILEELLHGIRFLVIAYPLKLGELNAYIQEKYPTYNVDVLGRVRLLDRLEAKKFWLYGPGNYKLKDVTPEQEKAGVFPDFEQVQRDFPQGIMYVIDEAHLYFDARAWASVGFSLSMWSSQHRKLNHHAVFITQHIDKLEKRLRLDAEQFIQCLNYGQRHIWTFFRLPAKFRTLTRYTYPGPVDRNSLASMDFKLAACYDTSAGVGLLGHSKPETKRKSGFSVYWILPILAAGVWLLTALPEYLAKKATGMVPGIHKDEEPAEATTTRAKPAGAPKEVAAEMAPLNRPLPIEEKNPDRVPLGETTEGIWITGYVSDGNHFRVTLSNGVTMAEDDAEMRGVTIRKNSMTLLDGRTYRVKQGSGVKVTPDRPGGVPPVEAFPVFTDREAVAARQSQRRAERDEESTPPPQQQGSWVVGVDGVSRLRESPTLSGGLSYSADSGGR